MPKFSLCLALLFALACQASFQIKIDVDGRDQPITFAGFQASPGIKAAHASWLPENERSRYLIFQGTRELGEQWENFTVEFVPEASGICTLAIRGPLLRETGQHRFVLYKNFQAEGCTLQNGDFAAVSRHLPTGWLGRPGHLLATPDGNAVYGTHNLALRQPITVSAGQKVTLTFAAKAGVTLPTTEMPVHVPVPPEQTKRAADAMPPEYYSYYDDEIKLLPLADKGIPGDSVILRDPDRQPRRPVPAPLFTDRPRTDETGSLDYAQVKLELLEEAGVPRLAPVRVGVPMPEGALFSLDHLRLLAPDGAELPAQFTITAFWPDDSLKWVLVQFQRQLLAGERQICTLEVGRQVKPRQHLSASLTLTPTVDAGRCRVNTGALDADISTAGATFTVPGRAPFQLDNLVLRNEQGKAVPFQATALQVEEQGPLTLTLRQEGAFGPHAAAVVRYRFHAGSAAVHASVRYLNNDLRHEFSDVTSLAWPLRLPQPCTSLAARIDGTGETFAAPARLFQKDDLTLARNGAEAAARLEGSLRLQLADGALGLGLRDAVWRYPKAFAVTPGQVSIEILPDQGSPAFGRHLPGYLRFPFLDGKYRLKWGMGFSENIFFDFAGSHTLEQVAAATQLPVLATIDRDWYFRCQVIQGAAPSSDRSFDEYDRKVDRALEGHLLSKAAQREYGFLNYGDWYGERSHNWGNNEYDLAHGLFVHFMRSGNRQAARLATLAAQHQADVDIVRAYKDPYYIGGNAEHSVGHTGVSYQIFDRASWTYRYDYSYSAENGHNWAQGMVNEWQMHGNAAVMESAILLGEHINNYMAPNFKALGTHERSAGWSLKTIMALYAATSDPAYLEAASTIVEVPLKAQNFKDGGAWPHKLPRDHAGGHPDTYGNCTFLIGILMEGLVQYHRGTGDPRVATSLTAAAEWLKRSFMDDECAWPYASSIAGKPYNQAAPGLNMLIAPAAIYVANLNQDQRLFEIAAMTMDRHTFTDMDPAGKALSIDLAMVSGLLDGLAIWNKTNPDRAYRYDRNAILRKFQDVRRNAFNLRAPEQKTFTVRLKKENPDMRLVRTKYGARPNFKPDFSFAIQRADGTALLERRLPTLEAVNETIPLRGRPGDTFSVTIDDDMTGIWTIPVSPDYDAWAELTAGSSVACRTHTNYFLQAPAGTSRFSVELDAVHPGGFGGMLSGPDGAIIVSQQSAKVGRPDLPWIENGHTAPAVLTLDSGPVPASGGNYQLTIWSSGDMRLNVKGIPARLSLAPVVEP